MKSADVTPGQVYTCKISGQVVHALVLHRLPSGAWRVQNLRSRRFATVKSPQRFREHVALEDAQVGRAS